MDIANTLGAASTLVNHARDGGSRTDMVKTTAQLTAGAASSTAQVAETTSSVLQTLDKTKLAADSMHVAERASQVGGFAGAVGSGMAAAQQLHRAKQARGKQRAMGGVRDSLIRQMEEEGEGDRTPELEAALELTDYMTDKNKREWIRSGGKAAANVASVAGLAHPAAAVAGTAASGAIGLHEGGRKVGKLRATRKNVQEWGDGPALPTLASPRQVSAAAVEAADRVSDRDNVSRIDRAKKRREVDRLDQRGHAAEQLLAHFESNQPQDFAVEALQALGVDDETCDELLRRRQARERDDNLPHLDEDQAFIEMIKEKLKTN